MQYINIISGKTQNNQNKQQPGQKHLQPSYHDFLIQKHHDWLKRKYAQKHNINLLSIPFKEIKNLKNILKERIVECQES